MDREAFLSSEVRILFEKPNNIMLINFNQLSIITVKDILDYSWGLFTLFPTISINKQKRIIDTFETKFNFDLDQYYIDMPLDNPIWNNNHTKIFGENICVKADLAYLHPAQLCYIAICDELLYRRVIKVLDKMGVQIISPRDKYIYDIEDLSNNIKYRLIYAKVGTLFEAISLSHEQIYIIRGFGTKKIALFESWQKKHLSELPENTGATIGSDQSYFLF